MPTHHNPPLNTRTQNQSASLSPSPDAAGDAPKSTDGRLKRRIAALQLENDHLKQRFRPANQVQVSACTAARSMRRVVSMFDPVESLVAESDRRRMVAEGDGLEVEDMKMSADQSDRMMRGHDELVRWFPEIAQSFERAEPEELADLYRQIRTGSDRGRGTDANKLKGPIISWLDEVYGTRVMPRLSEEHKEDRGLNHNATARMLIPPEWDWNDEGTRAKIKAGHPDYVLSADDWPTFLYENYKSDPNDLEKGLFKSRLLVKAFKLIFTSSSSVNDFSAAPDVTGDGDMLSGISDSDQENRQNSLRHRLKRRRTEGVRAPVAKILKMCHATGRSIAYSAVQLYFSMSSTGMWSDFLEEYEYVVLYSNIVDYFEVPMGPIAQQHVKELLDWWDRMVFPHGEASKNRVRASGQRKSGSVARLVHQRMMKENRED
ncbi:hypothetical protein BKA93DRAFT_748672 [Sparassis latifolia]